MLDKYQQILREKGELYLRLKVHPGAKETAVRALMADETIKVDLKAAPENGRANEALVACLAAEFEVKREQVKILSGAAERQKLIKITI